MTTIRYHALGNVLGPVFIYASSLISISILLASGLSFLGLGVRPPVPDWGLMLSTLRQSIYVSPLVCALPGVEIFITSMCCNLVPRAAARRPSARIVGRPAPAGDDRYGAVVQSAFVTGRRADDRARRDRAGSGSDPAAPAAARARHGHDLSHSRSGEIAATVAVMYAGRIVESGPVAQILSAPEHPYTAGLLASTVHGQPRDRDIDAIPGSPPDLRRLAQRCSFAPRCPGAWPVPRRCCPNRAFPNPAAWLRVMRYWTACRQTSSRRYRRYRDRTRSLRLVRRHMICRSAALLSASCCWSDAQNSRNKLPAICVLPKERPLRGAGADDTALG